MRKVMAVILILIILCGTNISFAQQYTLWDIPWTIRKGEIADYVYEKTGIVLTPLEDDAFYAGTD